MALVFMKDSPTITAAEWQARVDLAAAHRLAVMHGFSEGIFNHLTLSVPGKSDRYYQIPFGLHWSEANASSFMEVGWDGQVLAGEGDVEQSAYCIHAPIHRLARLRAAHSHALRERIGAA
jgi:ribulose-5-phosphate 4-epimerase/fuculose-1-phosphate aldolase